MWCHQKKQKQKQSKHATQHANTYLSQIMLGTDGGMREENAVEGGEEESI